MSDPGSSWPSCMSFAMLLGVLDIGTVEEYMYVVVVIWAFRIYKSQHECHRSLNKCIANCSDSRLNTVVLLYKLTQYYSSSSVQINPILPG